MCGIVGIISKNNSIPTVLEGLKALEYRGYDSAGIGYIHNKKIKEWSWNLVYFIIPLILLSVNNFVISNYEYFLAFTSGALFYEMIRKN